MFYTCFIEGVKLCLGVQFQVVGINTLVVQSTDSGDLAQGLGFAIPSNTVSTVARQLIAQGNTR